MQSTSQSVRQLATAPPPRITFRSLQSSADALAFRTLNEEWITRDFVLEPKDRETLGDPQNTIVRKGGKVILAVRQGLNGCEELIVGCVALIPMGNEVFELSKMAVSPAHRGAGIGRRLIEQAITQARSMGAASLFLGSNSILADAIHLYESIGFRHVPAERLPPMHYSRANVFMELQL